MDYLDQVDINSPDIEVITEATVGQEQVEIFVFVEKTNLTSLLRVCLRHCSPSSFGCRWGN